MRPMNGVSHQQQSNAKRRFTSATLWTPAIPWLESHLPSDGRIVSAYRALRLLWVVFLMPLHLALCATTVLPLPEALQPPAWLLPGADLGWTRWQRLCMPFLRRMIWAITDVGSAPDLSPEEERSWTGWIVKAQHWIFGDGTHHVNVAVEDCPPAAEDEWIKDEAADPRGLVKPAPVPMFWFDAGSADQPMGGQASRRAKEGERVVLYFVGGGYAYGSPIEGNRCFVLAARTGLLIIGANYRKATTPDRAFPAALQDAISAYSHLLDLGFQDIILAGDSAGGGLAMSFALYLTNTLITSKSSLILPSAILLYSPWVDLTLSCWTEGIGENDIICPSMLWNVRNAYVQNLDTSADLKNLSHSSPFALGASHPFLSPALLTSLPYLQTLAESYTSSKPLRMLIFAGGAEIFCPEIRAFVAQLRKVSGKGGNSEQGALSVDFVEAKGEVHGFPLVPTWVSPAAGRALDLVETFLTRR